MVSVMSNMEFLVFRYVFFILLFLISEYYLNVAVLY